MSFRFRDWQVYKDSLIFRREIEISIIKKLPKEERFEFASQLKRAVNSVILNIAEGSYRKTDKDFSHFLNQAIASLYEVVACLDIIEQDRYINKAEVEKFTQKAEDIAKQLSAFVNKLKNN